VAYEPPVIFQAEYNGRSLLGRISQNRWPMVEFARLPHNCATAGFINDTGCEVFIDQQVNWLGVPLNAHSVSTGGVSSRARGASIFQLQCQVQVECSHCALAP